MIDREELWMRVAVAVAGSDESIDMETPGAWANQVLEDFDKRFPVVDVEGNCPKHPDYKP